MTEAEHEEMRLKRIQEKNRRNQRKFRARQRVSVGGTLQHTRLAAAQVPYSLHDAGMPKKAKQ